MSLTPKELEYLAECEPIQIVPNFNLPVMYMIGGDVGPLRAGIPCRVPLWLAINLHRSAKCKIIPPDWMSVDTLQRIKDEEKSSEVFTPMPSDHYMAIGKLLFQACPGDIKDCDEIKTLVKDIWDIRYAKLRRSIKVFLSQEEMQLVAVVKHLTMMEMCQIRPFINHSMEQIHRVKREVSKAIETSQTLMQTINSQSQSQ